MIKSLTNIIPILIFGLLSAVIVFPLLSPGYILTLDTVMTPKGYPAPEFFSPSFIYSSIVWILNFLIPAYFIQKIIIFLIFFLSGWGMYRLVKVENVPARIFAGLFYALNPFVYERLMAGQWHLLLGYSIFPFFIGQVIDFFRNPNKKNAILLSVFITIIISTVIHYSLILGAFFLVYFTVQLIFTQERIISIVKNLVLLIVLTFILNANWLIPSVVGWGSLAQSISSFSHEDLIAFQSVPDANFGLVFNLLSGYGFWPEVYDYFLSPKKILIIWPLISVVIILSAFYGLLREIQKKDQTAYPFIFSLLILLFLSLDLSGGVALSPIAPGIVALYEKFSFMRGFREPQKLIAVVMFVFAYLGAVGLDSLLSKIKKGISFLIICCLFLILPFVYTPAIFGGFWGQLKPVFYPKSWEQVDQLLKSDKDNYLSVAFPWHQYMKFGFNNNRIISNPAPYFFDKPVLSSQNYETIPLYTHDTRTEALHMDGLLRIQQEGINLLGEEVNERVDWAQGLSVVNIKYIILLKDADWSSYGFLDTASSLQKIYDGKEIALYQNLAWSRLQDLSTEED